MDSGGYGVPVSSTPSPPPAKVAVSGIRAPLTIDSDVEMEQSNSGKEYYFYSESEGFYSGEDEYEGDLERPVVKGFDESSDSGQYGTDKFEESGNFDDSDSGQFGSAKFEESRNFDDYMVSKKYPFEESSDSGQFGSFRPLGSTRNDNFEESVKVGDYMVSEPYSSGQVDESVEGGFGIGIGIEESGKAKVKYPVSPSDMESEYASDENVDNVVSFQPMVGIPIAQVSGDSDYDSSVYSDVLDDDIAFSPVRIPDKVLERFNSINKGRVVEDVKEENTPSESEMSLELKAAKDSVEEENSLSNSEILLELKDAKDSVEGEFVKEPSSAVQDRVHGVSEFVGQDFRQPSEQGKECKHSAVESSERDDDHINEKQSLDREKYIDDIHGFEPAKVVQDDAHGQSSEPGLECDRSALETKFQHDDNICVKQGGDLHKDAAQIDLDNETVEASHNEQTDLMIDSHDSVTVSGSPPEGSIQDDAVPSTGHADLTDKLSHQGSLHSTEDDEVDHNPTKQVEDAELLLNKDVKSVILDSSGIVEEEREQLSRGLISDITPVDEISEDYAGVDGQVTTDSDEEFEGHVDNQGEEIFDAAAFDALLKAATNAATGDNSISVVNSGGTTMYPLERSGGVGSSFRPLGPSTEGALSKAVMEQLEKLQQIRVKYLRLLQRLNRSDEDLIAGQILYKLVLAARSAGETLIPEFGYEYAKREAMELEADGKNDLNLSMNILVIGKSGVGKSATINSIFTEMKAMVNAFEPTTTYVKEITGTVNGVNIRVLDTPGLSSSLAEQSQNRKILCSIKKFISKYPPDVVLYVDRLDSQAKDLNDLPLLKSITKYLGPALWRNAIVTLTHGASLPPDGPYGYPLSYDTFIAQRARVVQQQINNSFAGGSLLVMCPVSLVENNFLFQADGDGETLLPNGISWRSQLLLLCCSTKILAEAASVLNTESALEHKRFFRNLKRPPLLYFISSLLQKTQHPKLSIDGGVENGDIDMELAYSSESDQDDEDEYDQLPPFKPLKKSQVAMLSKDQRKAYLEEYDYRVKLLQKKQLREEAKRIREMKRGKSEAGDYDQVEGESDQETANSISVPLPDMVLPPSFDSNNPAYRYRFLEASSQLLTRPVLDSRGWDHDVGYDGVNIEDSQVIAGQFPAVISVQLMKDKKKFNFSVNSSVAAKHGDNGSTMAGLDIQTLGKQLAYILKSEYKLKNYKINETAAALSVSFVGENIVSGLKMEDQIALTKQLSLAVSTASTHCQGDAAYGANVEVRLREKDFPVGKDQSTLGLSLMKSRGELIWGCNLQSEFSVGRNYRIGLTGGLNNKMNGQISIRTSSSDQLQIAMLALVPIANTIFRNIFRQSSGTQ